MTNKPGDQDDDREIPQETPALDYSQKGGEIEPKESQPDRVEK